MTTVRIIKLQKSIRTLLIKNIGESNKFISRDRKNWIKYLQLQIEKERSV